MPHAQRRIVRVGAAVFAAGMAALGVGWLGFVALVGLELAYAIRGSWQKAIPMLAIAASCGVMVSVSPQLGGQLIYAAVYAAIAIWLVTSRASNRAWMMAAAMQFLTLTAVFVLISVTHIPVIIALLLAWGSAYAAADFVMTQEQDGARGLLASAWALVVAELTWVLSVWLIQYVLAGGMLIIPLPAVVITGFGYSFAGIYFSHLRGKLNRARLLEYLMIGGVFLALIIFGTKWSGG